MNPSVAMHAPSARSLRYEILKERRLRLRFRALISGRIRTPRSVGVYEMASSVRGCGRVASSGGEDGAACEACGSLECGIVARRNQRTGSEAWLI